MEETNRKGFLVINCLGSTSITFNQLMKIQNVLIRSWIIDDNIHVYIAIWYTIMLSRKPSFSYKFFFKINKISWLIILFNESQNKHTMVSIFGLQNICQKDGRYWGIYLETPSVLSKQEYSSWTEYCIGECYP